MMEENEKIKELKTLFEEIQECFRNRELEQVLEKADVLYAKAEEVDNAYFMGNSLNYKGVTYYNLNNTPDAIKCYEKSMVIFENSELMDDSRNSKISLGALYKNMGEYSKALNVLIEATEIVTESTEQDSSIYNNIGVVYFAQSDYYKTLEYYKKAIKIEEDYENSNKKLITKYLVNIASVYLKMDRLDEAEAIYFKTIKICEKNQDYEFLITSIKGLTKLWADRNQIEKAENILNKGLDLSQQFNFHIHIVDFSLYLADLCKKRNKNKLRGRHLNIALDAAKKSNRSKEMLVYENLNQFYKEIGDMPAAYKNLTEMFELSKAQFEKEKQERLLELQERFESQQKDKLIEQEKQFSEELKFKNQELEELNDDLKQFNHGVSHDLKEPIRLVKSQLTFLKMKEKKGVADTSERNALATALAASDRLEKMLEDLFLFSSLGRDLKPAKIINLNEVLAIVQADLQLRIRETNTTINIDTLPKIKGYKIMYVQLFQNLINNAIKFKKPGIDPEIKIVYLEKKDWHQIEVHDNGVGIKQEHISKVFQLFSRLKEMKEVEGSGVGLSIVQKIIKKMQGEISLASIYGMGSTFIIKLPKF